LGGGNLKQRETTQKCSKKSSKKLYKQQTEWLHSERILKIDLDLTKLWLTTQDIYLGHSGDCFVTFVL